MPYPFCHARISGKELQIELATKWQYIQVDTTGLQLVASNTYHAVRIIYRKWGPQYSDQHSLGPHWVPCRVQDCQIEHFLMHTSWPGCGQERVRQPGAKSNLWHLLSHKTKVYA